MTNEYAILSPPVSTVNRYLELIELLQAEDLIDAIGVQGHAFSTRWAVSEMVEHLDILGETGLPVYITEMSLDGNPNRSPTMTQAVSDENQLEAFKRIFPALWEHPSVEGITFWGWRPGMWRSDAEAYLVREDGEERPAMEWLRQYLENYEPAEPPDNDSDDPVNELQVRQNYPNPFVNETLIAYYLPDDSNVNVTIFDVLGRRVITLVNEAQEAGEHEVIFSAGQYSGLASGFYVYRIHAGNMVQSRAMILVKQ